MEIFDPDSDHALVPKEKLERLQRGVEIGDGSGFRGYIRGEQGPISMKETINNPKPKPDRDDIEMLFRCGMQFMRYLAKKYGFTIKQWPEK